MKPSVGRSEQTRSQRRFLRGAGADGIKRPFSFYLCHIRPYSPPWGRPRGLAGLSRPAKSFAETEETEQLWSQQREPALSLLPHQRPARRALPSDEGDIFRVSQRIQILHCQL